VCRAQEFRPKPCQVKGGKKKRNRVNRDTDGFVEQDKRLKTARQYLCAQLSGRKTVGREIAARYAHSPCRPGHRSLAGAKHRKVRSNRSTKLQDQTK
jgi:hypothetical protein